MDHDVVCRPNSA